MATRRIGTVKITAKRTIRRTATYRQQIQGGYHLDYESVPDPVAVPASVSSSAAALERSIKNLESAVKHLTRPAKLPSGVYSPRVEQLYDEINSRSKSDEAEEAAIYDVFISHASEDKKDFVEPLVDALQDAGIRVWYDAIEMEWGKSLRDQIDRGIKRSKYAILVLSRHFFAKEWTRRELDGILAKEEMTGAAPLPIWYNITKEEVYEFSPMLVGLFALSTDQYSIDDICQAFKLILQKEVVKE